MKKRRNYKDKNNPNYKDGKYCKNKIYYCVDCDKKITANSISGKCRSCSLKGKIPWNKNKKTERGKKASRYIDGRSIKKYYCVNCGKGITKTSGFYGSKNCGSCSAKERLANPRNHPNYIEGITKESLIGQYIKNKKSINHIAKKIGHSCKVIRGRLIKYNIPIRTISESLKFFLKDPRNHPNWQGGKSFEPYPLGWNNTFKEQIRYRDGYKCQICGVPEVETGRRLDVHHIDYDKKNINPENLTSLCKSCHMTTNFNRNYWKELFSGHFI